ncbi:chromosome partition protein MukE [Vibrio aestuarianus]|uniref:Chromosome partition protein MukE n=1 Tax=Vibrio aestuarianus TaxID=28171 RepID=A0ABM9FRQ5_9VIBR|nr:chromosome partition protein MukE [Vibrio aestuarianus]MDE1215228.1 chromosome partition protein MukE [Vibrio aestuarianus]MDE1217107.1 chromosome partition protein MukE [Vibrio aestuarianus]MDE1228177.1 chromosome partition protein MukE [Vibrio aestuarianus]MDE1256848.1 chromosome partition protein MukE [Vibrio aestuarianus]MDE1262322.1 chromosome partition protein MukE [Vibrio aestuarianus]
MLSTDTNEYMPENLAKAITNPLFPALDSQLRAGRHVSSDDLDNHAFLSDFEPDLALFYQRYNTELVKAPEGFFYLRPRSTALINRSVLSELDMLVGKVLCFLYLSPERLAHEGIFTNQELYEELLSLADEKKLMKLVTNRASGSDLDKEKLFEKVRTSLRRLRRLGMIINLGDTNKFRISEAVFRFGADVRVGDDMREAQLRLIRDGEAVVHTQEPNQRSLLDNEQEIEEQDVNEQTEWEGEE